METIRQAEYQISALNDLIKINNDRIVGYQKGIEGSTDSDLKDLFATYIRQSRSNASELENHVRLLGGIPANDTTIAGKFYHAWMDLKSAFTAKDRYSILADCEYGEDVAKKAYREAINDEDLSWSDAQVISIITAQYDGINRAHNQIKMLRDHTTAID